MRFAPRDPPDAAAFVARAVTTAPYRYQAKILIHAPAAAVAALVPPSSGVVTEDGPGRCLLTTGSDSLSAMAMHIAMLDAPVTVLEPAGLTERMRELADRLRQAAG